ncbi:MAG: hypothetical protein A2010_15025 [Nitrospirae bacterium GWD2_57_9]|nr:MAG: hypothetical protein A2010_15025 [Nitrospirae bacterium GWD2_57_9]
MLFFFSSFAGALAIEPVEARKIEFLIASVENLQGAKFIRNGSEYDSKKAGEHLRYKLKKAGNRVKTSEDFITLIASRSYLSGKPYLIKYEDGTTVETEIFFRSKLREFSVTK